MVEGNNMTEPNDDSAELDFEKIRNYTLSERQEKFRAFKASLLQPPTVGPAATAPRPAKRPFRLP
jgi:hypothetical protein